MLEVHIPSVGPEAEGTRQNPEKGHMVSWGSGWEGARGPTGFPRAEGNGDPALRSRARERGGPGGRGTPCRGSLGRWGLLALPTAVPAPEGLHRAESPSVRERGRVPGEPRSSQAALCFCGRTVGWGRRRERVWRRPCAGSHAHPAARRRPPGVPSGGAVPRAQTRRAEALQRVPRAPQAGKAAPTTDPRTPAGSCPAPAQPPEVSATPITSPGPGELRSWTQTSPRAAERAQSWAGPRLCSSRPWAAGLRGGGG